MKVVLYEYATAHLDSASIDFLGEGYAMASTLCEAFVRYGFECTMPLSRELYAMRDALMSPGVRFQLIDNLKDTLARADIAIIIAPEADCTLSKILEECETFGVKLLNGGHEDVGMAGDKWCLFQILESKGIKTPRTSLIPAGHVDLQIPEDELPVVVKPRVGTGAKHLALVRDRKHLVHCLSACAEQRRDVIIQRFIPGVAASVTILAGDDCYPLSLNKQRLELSDKVGGSRYLGGMTPLVHPYSEEAFELAVETVRSFKGLKGLVGVDLILNDEGVWVVEVNPRPTTPIVALATLDPYGLVDSIVKVQQGDKPDALNLAGFCSYLKLPVRHWGAKHGVRWFPPLSFPYRSTRALYN